MEASHCYNVDAGHAPFTGIVATSPLEAIKVVKDRIKARGENAHRADPEISMSLVTALNEGRLSFLVFDPESKQRRFPIAGEYDGQYQEPISVEFARRMSRRLPNDVLRTIEQTATPVGNTNH